MKKWLPCFLIGSALAVQCAVSAESRPILESIEWTDIWVTHANERSLPRVLLAGDSITRGYYRIVEKKLAGKAHCARFATSMFLANPDYLETLKILLKRYDFAVIHINNGLHGRGYSEEQYAKGFPPLFKLLKTYAPRAKIIWAATTPVRERGHAAKIDENATRRVRERNRIAFEFMKERGIPVDDLFSPVLDHPEYFQSDGVHYNAKGYQVLGGQVAAAISKALNGGGRPEARR